MGTGAVGIALGNNPTGLAGMAAAARVVGLAFLGAAATLLVVLAVRSFLLGDVHRRVTQYWRSPTAGPSLATIPGGMNVVAVGVLGLLPAVAQSDLGWAAILVLGSLATAMGVALTFGFFSHAFANEDLDAREISGAWFIPETVLLLGSLVFSKLALSAPAGAARSLAIVALLLLGAGSVLYALTAALFFMRLVVVGPKQVAGPMWIMLSPLSVSCLALQFAALNTRSLGGIWDDAVRSTADFIAAMLYGFAIWWVGPALIATRASGQPKLTGGPQDWAYVFPAAALSVASVTLAGAWESGLLRVLGVVLTAASLAAWVVVGWGSVGVRRRTATA